MAEKILGKKMKGNLTYHRKRKHYETTEVKSLIASLWANTVQWNKAFRNRFMGMYIKRFNRNKDGEVNQGKD